MSAEQSSAAHGHALVAEAHASGISPGRLIARRMREQLDARPKVEADSVPGRTWRAMEKSVREMLVLMAADEAGEPQALAARPWEKFSDADRASIAAMARMVRDELREAAALW